MTANLMHDILASHVTAYAAALPERSLSPPDNGSLTTAETNALQEAVEDRADREFDVCAAKFLAWLESHDQRVRHDYRQWRVATLSEDEQIEIEQELGFRTHNWEEL